jgi:hypothetical protein
MRKRHGTSGAWILQPGGWALTAPNFVVLHPEVLGMLSRSLARRLTDVWWGWSPAPSVVRLGGATVVKTVTQGDQVMQIARCLPIPGSPCKFLATVGWTDDREWAAAARHQARL